MIPTTQAAIASPGQLLVGRSLVEPSKAEIVTAERLQGQALKVLVVDNDVPAATALVQQLISLRQCDGDEFKCARHGLDAMIVAEEFQPKLVIMEIGWPRQSGTCTARLIRSRTWSKQSVIVSHVRDEENVLSPTTDFDFHFFDRLEPEVLMQIYDNLAIRRLKLGRSFDEAHEFSSHLATHSGENVGSHQARSTAHG